MGNSSFMRTLLLVGLGLAAIFTVVGITKLGINVDAKEIVVVQHPISGEFEVYTDAGFHQQYWGTVTRYKKSVQYWFDGKDGHEQPIPVKFNDGGHATIPGSIRIDMPMDKASIIRLHTKYGSQEAIEDQLVGQVLTKSIYMAGPTMTSKESYAERKTDLLYYVEDQAKHGVYKTTQKEVKITDPLTGQERITTVVDILKDSTGQPQRVEESLIQAYNINLNNLSFGDFNYDDVVKKQIATQQQAVMQVQTAIAKAKEAEQEAITTEQQGKAAATKAKWEQETIKAKAVTEAEQNRDVAKLNADAEEQNKRANILKGEGESAYKRLVTQANNNLELRLNTWLEGQKVWANAMMNYKGALVPQWQQGGTAGTGSNAAQQFMDLMNMKAAKELGVDINNK